MKILILSFLMFFAFIQESCEEQKAPKSSDQLVSAQTEQTMAESRKVVGMPNITNWTEKKLVRDLYELRDKENLLTYTYIFNMNGDRIFLGKSIGYGIPASVQYTNPSKIWDAEIHGGAKPKFEDNGEIQVIQQPEPNGLFMPDGLSATWVFLLDSKGNPRPVYIEPQIMVSPFPLH